MSVSFRTRSARIDSQAIFTVAANPPSARAALTCGIVKAARRPQAAKPVKRRPPNQSGSP